MDVAWHEISMYTPMIANDLLRASKTYIQWEGETLFCKIIAKLAECMLIDNDERIRAAKLASSLFSPYFSFFFLSIISQQMRGSRILPLHLYRRVGFIDALHCFVFCILRNVAHPNL